jgi:hypothetical protein
VQPPASPVRALPERNFKGVRGDCTLFRDDAGMRPKFGLADTSRLVVPNPAGEPERRFGITSEWPTIRTESNLALPRTVSGPRGRLVVERAVEPFVMLQPPAPEPSRYNALRYQQECRATRATMTP